MLEVFDGDGGFWLDAPGGTFAGSPVGCDANGDEVIDAGDLSCKILLIFNGPGACDGSPFIEGGWGQPILSMKRARQDSFHAIPSVPIYFRPRGWSINSLAFSIDYDERAFTFDPSDRDGDGVPDAIRFDLPASAQVTASFDRADSDGEIDISILDPNQAIGRGIDEPLLTIRLRPLELSRPDAARVGFSHDPAASFGDLFGRSIAGTTSDGRRK